MYNPLAPDLARLITEDRIREADQDRLVRVARRREQPAAAATAAREARGPSRLWKLVHVHHASTPLHQ